MIYPWLKALHIAGAVVWIGGMLAMAVQGGWIWAPWFLSKLAILTALSALHGIQSGTLRRMARDPCHVASPVLWVSAPAILVTLPLAAVLAVLKPF